MTKALAAAIPGLPSRKSSKATTPRCDYPVSKRQITSDICSHNPWVAYIGTPMFVGMAENGIPGPAS